MVNATGPWADGLPHSRVKLRLTKGIHLVVDHGRLPVTETVVMTEGKRILFAIPWGQRTILGTTDTDYDGPLDDVRADAADIGYVLQIANQFFPAAKLAAADVISVWAGLRPLVADPSGKPSDISRAHEIHNPEPGWWDVAGGKLTTYRLMGEQTVDQIVKWLPGLQELHKVHGERERCRTAAEPLLPTAETDGVSGILPPEFSRKTVEHYHRQRMGRALGRCDGAADELALLLQGRRGQGAAGRRLDGRAARLDGGPAGGRNRPLRPDRELPDQPERSMPNK